MSPFAKIRQIDYFSGGGADFDGGRERATRVLKVEPVLCEFLVKLGPCQSEKLSFPLFTLKSDKNHHKLDKKLQTLLISTLKVVQNN